MQGPEDDDPSTSIDLGRAETVAATTTSPDGGTDVARAPTVAAPSTGPRPVSVDEAPLLGGFERYLTLDLLGAGGMGEVHRCNDSRIGRDVAIKVIRVARGGSSGAVRRRFEREARIQGQLEHPSIVPVYDLGVRPDGVAYFTMKRVRGRTLEEILLALREGDEATQADFSRHRLLAAFGAACQAIAYANSRGVVHRDLKPANIILGDFGEVYVLDWGIAKLLGEAEEDVVEAGDLDSGDATQAGALLGTPGYMAPEQARGSLELDARVDVYALGLILYELLTLERYHQGQTAEALLLSTMSAPAAHPIERRPDDVPPELDAICAAATEPDLDARLDGVRELHRRLEAYLAGDRDAQQRRLLAEQHVEAAERALSEGAGDPERDIENRSRAIRELITAFSLVPDHPGARHAMVAAIGGGDAALPARARDELEELRSEQRRRAARNAAIGLFGIFCLAPLVLWNGLTDPGALWPMLGALAVALGVSVALSRAARIPPTRYVGLMVVLSVFTATTAPLFGPLLVTPMLALALASALIAGARMEMAWRATVIVLAVLSVLAPTALEVLSGEPSYAVLAGHFTIAGSVLEPSSDRTPFVLLVMAVVGIVAPCMLIGRSVDILHRAEERMFAQAWRLRQIFPDEVRDGPPS